MAVYVRRSVGPWFLSCVCNVERGGASAPPLQATDLFRVLLISLHGEHLVGSLLPHLPATRFLAIQGVEGHRSPRTSKFPVQRTGHGLHELPPYPRPLRRVQQVKDPSEGVVRGALEG
jgi:hypothetical protein